MKELTPDQINDEFLDFQEDLLIRERRLRLLPDFRPDEDLYSLAEAFLKWTPDLTGNPR